MTKEPSCKETEYGSEVCMLTAPDRELIERLRGEVKAKEDLCRLLPFVYELKGVSKYALDELQSCCPTIITDSIETIEERILNGLGSSSIYQALEKIPELAEDLEVVAEIINKFFVVPKEVNPRNVENLCKAFGVPMESRLCEHAIRAEFYFFHALVNFLECRSNGVALQECVKLLPHTLRVNAYVSSSCEGLKCLQKLLSKVETSLETKEVIRTMIRLAEEVSGTVIL